MDEENVPQKQVKDGKICWAIQSEKDFSLVKGGLAETEQVYWVDKDDNEVAQNDTRAATRRKRGGPGMLLIREAGSEGVEQWVSMAHVVVRGQIPVAPYAATSIQPPIVVRSRHRACKKQLPDSPLMLATRPLLTSLAAHPDSGDVNILTSCEVDLLRTDALVRRPLLAYHTRTLNDESHALLTAIRLCQQRPSSVNSALLGLLHAGVWRDAVLRFR